MFGPKIKLSKDLYDKVKEASEAMACSSVEEFVEGVLEREINKIEASQKKSDDDSDRKKEADDIAKKLKGLGYLE